MDNKEYKAIIKKGFQRCERLQKLEINGKNVFRFVGEFIYHNQLKEFFCTELLPNFETQIYFIRKNEKIPVMKVGNRVIKTNLTKRLNNLLNYLNQEKILPAFLKGVKKYNKELYKELLKYEKVKKLDEETSFVGAKAKVKTLKKGFIQVTEKISLSDDYTAYWNGESIELTFKDSKNFNKIIIEPNEDYIVTIIDEDTVDENTIFETKFNF